MSLSTAIAALLLASALAWGPLHKARRQRHYAALAARATAASAEAPRLVPLSPLVDLAQAQRLVSADGFPPPEQLERLRAEAVAAEGRLERSFIPGHKQGGTLAYEHIPTQAPGCSALTGARPSAAGCRTSPAPRCSPPLCAMKAPARFTNTPAPATTSAGTTTTTSTAAATSRYCCPWTTGAPGGLSATRLQRRGVDGRNEGVPIPAASLGVVEG